jgi:hypothetical protein
MIRRREFMTMGFSGQSTRSAASEWVAAFTQRLRELDWIEGRTVTIEYRWSEGRTERFAQIAAEFVRPPSSIAGGAARMYYDSVEMRNGEYRRPWAASLGVLATIFA